MELVQPLLVGFNLLTIPFVITRLGNGNPGPLGAVCLYPLSTDLACALSRACQLAQLALPVCPQPLTWDS